MRTDLISRNKLYTAIRRQPCRVIDDREYILRDAVLEKINIAPSVNAAEAVQGKRHPNCGARMDAKEVLRATDLGCVYCRHSKLIRLGCIATDVECEDCTEQEYPCRSCRDNSNWEWGPPA